MKTILVVENDFATLELICTILEVNGIRAVASAVIWNVQEIEALMPDLVLVDYLLQGAFGDELCRQIKQNPGTAHIPVILISAVNNVEDIGIASGADGFIYKPFDLRKFEQKIKKYL